jgi:hypothetical protein
MHFLSLLFEARGQEGHCEKAPPFSMAQGSLDLSWPEASGDSSAPFYLALIRHF